MELNNFIWNNFKQTADYQYHRQSLLNFNNVIKNGDFEDLERILSDEKAIIKVEMDKDVFESFRSLIDDFNEIRRSTPGPKEFYKAALDLFVRDDDDNGNSVVNYRSAYELMYNLMYLFSIFDGENFFFFNFNRETQYLKLIFDEFNLGFPRIPSKRDHFGRVMFYFELCQAAKEIHNYIECDGIDICILFNFFGKEAIKRQAPEMREPLMAYFIGGGIGSEKNEDGSDLHWDFESLDNAKDDTVYNWQGNAYARPGDIFVMYCLAPRSYIHSIWQATDYGFVDPFFYFYNNTYIGHPKIIPPITLKELRSDKVLKDMPLVRGSMQGVNGVKIEKKYYDRILELLKEKGYAIENLPQLPNTFYSTEDLHDERDVEIKLIEPLLTRLDFTTQEYTRQLRVKIGRNEKIIPDYVCHPTFKNKDWSCEWIWESKYSIANPKELERDFIQAKSYALRLNAKGLSLAAKEGIWVTTDFSDYEKLNFFSWSDLGNNITFDTLRKIAGNHK